MHQHPALLLHLYHLLQNPLMVMFMLQAFLQPLQQLLQTCMGTRLQAKLMVPLLFTSMITHHGQEQIRQYSIYRNGKQIGSLTFSIREQPGEVHLKLDSEVKAKMIVSFSMKSLEESRFQQNKLVYSSVRRHMNGSEKENKSITAVGGQYRINNKGAISSFAHPPIQYSTLCLYAWEPVQVSQVYSDLHQKLIPIKKLGAGHYKVSFPDGKENEFWYKGGTCTRIALNSQWYDAEVVLQKTQTRNF